MCRLVLVVTGPRNKWMDYYEMLGGVCLGKETNIKGFGRDLELIWIRIKVHFN